MTSSFAATRIDDPQGLYDALMRESFPLFLRKAVPWITGGVPLDWNWHLDAIARQLELVDQGSVLRLLVNLPPRNLKSITISVAWVAWMLGRDPTKNFVCISYSGELAGKLARDCLSIMESNWFRQLFPATCISRKRSATHDFETTAGGGRMATSITGTLTGRGGDIIIIDDPIKPDEAFSKTIRTGLNDWYRSTLTSRLNDKRSGAIICVMQRLHENDLAGLMIADGGWSHLSLPAIADETAAIALTSGRVYHRYESDILHPGRESYETLMKIKADQGPNIFAAQYQQTPIPETGNMIEKGWLCYETVPEEENSFGIIIQSWDTASKDGADNDWSVCVTARYYRKKIYIIDVFRRKMKFPELKETAIRLAREHKARVILIEDAASGTQLYQTLVHEKPKGVAHPFRQRPEGDKISRVAGISAMIASGQVILPQSAQWLTVFVSELLAFPKGTNDDQVDAFSQLLIYVLKMPKSNYSSSTTGPMEVSISVPHTSDTSHYGGYADPDDIHGDLDPMWDDPQY